MSTIQLELDRLIPTPDNPRFAYRGMPGPNDPAIAELAESIKAVGLLQPVLARPHPTEKGMFDLRFGFRRWAAAKVAGLLTIETYVRDMDDREAMEATIVENKDREDLHPLEEAAGVQKLLELGYDQETAAAKLGKSPAWVARRASLTNLIDAWLAAAQRPEPLGPGEEFCEDHPRFGDWLTAGHMELIARFPAEAQAELLEDVRDEAMYESRGMTIADLRRLVGERLRVLADALWALEDETLVPEVGACSACTKRSSCQPLLFDDADDQAMSKRQRGGGDKCLDAGCHDRKRMAYLKTRHAELEQKHGRPVAVVKEAYEGPVVEKAFPKAAYVYSYERGKKSDANAVPVMAISGSKAGQIQWMKPHRGQPAAAAARTRPRDADGKPIPTPLKERRAKLTKRRQVHVVQAVLETMDQWDERMRMDTCYGWMPDIVLCLAAAFGMYERENWSSSDPWATYDKYIANQKGDGILKADARILESVMEVWQARLLDALRFDRPAEAYAEAKRIGQLLAIDLEVLDHEAEEAIPQPKSWATLKADGTPKTKASPKPPSDNGSTTKSAANGKRKRKKKVTRRNLENDPDIEKED